MLDINKKIIKIKLGWVGVHPKGLKAFMTIRRKMRQFYCRKTVWLDGGKIKAVRAENIPHYPIVVVLSIQPLLRQSGITFLYNKGKKMSKFNKTNSHSELVSASQTGRSMVEMLGVLAVMGVLSVGGVAMYTNAMNKHRANELLNEASKRAAIVAAQALQGRENLSINEFPNNTALKFSETVTHDKTNGQFTLEIGGVSEAVCQQMKNAMGPVIRKFEPATCVDDATVKLTYNDDMSTTAKACDYNTDPCADVTCGTGASCSDGYCVCTNGAPYLGYLENPCASTVNKTCTDDSECEDGSGCCASDGKCYARDWDNEVCDDEGCTNPCLTPTKRCTSNSDCGEEEYCQMGSEVSCEEPSYGTCQPLGGSKSITAAQLSTLTSAGFVNTIEASADEMNWWEAVNWCQAKGKQLIGIEDLNVFRSGTETQVVDNTAWSYGCASGKTCGDWSRNPYNAMWSGDTVTDAADESGEKYREKYSAKLVALRQVFGTTYFWTKSGYNNESCSAFGVNLSYGDVSNFERNGYATYALCE